MIWRQASLAPVYLKLKEKTDLEEPTPLADQVYLGCTQRESVTKESENNLMRRATEG